MADVLLFLRSALLSLHSSLFSVNMEVIVDGPSRCFNLLISSVLIYIYSMFECAYVCDMGIRGDNNNQYTILSYID